MPGVLHDSPKCHRRLTPRTEPAWCLEPARPCRCRALPSRARPWAASPASRLHQHFTNPYPIPLELTYSFPLPADGAVAGYEIRAGNRLIKGRIERRDERADTSTKRRALEGRTACTGRAGAAEPLHAAPREHSRLDGCDRRVDNRSPVAWIAGGGWEWRFPTVVAPRYLGPRAPSRTPTP